MSRPTNNYLVNNDKHKSRRNIDFISTLAEIAEPFQSTLLDKYPEYQNDIQSYQNDEKECFLSILNKIGEDGCQVLTDRIVNYIDDVSNVDTTTPSALLSQAESIGYPYKDKKTVEQLTRLSKCSPLLQNLVWAVSTNATNSRTILQRLNIKSDITSVTTDGVNTEISSSYYDNISSKVFGRRYLYLDRDENSHDVVSSEDSPALIDFSWVLFSIFSDDIVGNYDDFNRFLTVAIDFGKYNRTIYAIACYSYLYSQLFKLEGEISRAKYGLEDLNKITKNVMPFLFDNKLFDPIQAAWSIIYDNATLNDFDAVYHSTIIDFIKAFNEKLNNVSYDAVMKFIKDAGKPTYRENLSFVYRLNAQSFSYQQLLVTFVKDVKSLFGIDIKDYFQNYRQYVDNLWMMQDSLIGNGHGFNYLDDSLLDAIDFDKYIKDVIEDIFDIGKRLRTLREDLRLMTLRNSYKGTTALIQFSVIEYLRDCIADLVYQSQEQYNFDNKLGEPVQIDASVFNTIIDNLSKKNTQEDVAVAEYWDYTEYFNRYFVDSNEVIIANANSGSRVDWNDPARDKINTDEWRTYGSMKDEEILDFYTKVLNLPKDVYLEKNENELGYDKSTTTYDDKLEKLKTFLQAVYNSGVFTERTNSNYEAIYSGKESETTNDSPWVAYKNQEFISKEIHPYIWNFTNRVASRLYRANAVSIAVQNAEYELLLSHIKPLGNIINQYRLSQNFVDSSGYVTRYENRNHAEKEKTQSYDGIVYPQFGYEFINKYNGHLDEYWSEISQTWYTDQVITLSDYMASKELNCLRELETNEPFIRSLSQNPDETELSGVLGNYCIDKYETAYATDPHTHKFIYKENGYPFMRPLVNGENGMLFIDANNQIDTEFTASSIDNEINDKFPRIVMSKDGTHLLLRKNKNTIRSYSVSTHKNAYNEMEKALILNAEITCDETIFEDDYFNDALIKTIDDDFYILVPQYKNNKFTNYLFYINKSGKVCALKQSVKDESNDNIFRSGMFFNGGSGIILNTYFVNKEQTLPSSSEVSAIYHEPEDSIGNHQTPYKNWEISSSSFDVLDQFVQQYSSKEFKFTNMTNIPVSYADAACPKVDLSLNAIDALSVSDYTEVSVINGFMYGYDNDFEVPFSHSTRLPFIRTFNINSDAGFNPIYIGERGRIILENRRGKNVNDDPPSQLSLALSTGAAFELLGPEVDFDTNVIVDSSTKENIYDEISNDNDRMFERIHEFYSSPDMDAELPEYAQSFDISCAFNSPRTSSYRYGYASIVEKNENKNDKYRIKGITSATFTVFHSAKEADKGTQLGYIKTKTAFDKIADTQEDDFAYNRIYVFLGVKNTLYSIIPRVPGTLLQPDEDPKEFYRLKKAINATSSNSYTYTMQFENNYVFDKIVFKNGYAYVYGKSLHEMLNADIYLVHVISNIEMAPTPNFMLPTEELRKAITNVSVDMIDEHMRTPHTEATEDYKNIMTAAYLNDGDVDGVNENDSIKRGSIVFSITEVDSEFMNRIIPDQQGKHDIKSVTVEALNDYKRYKEGMVAANKTFDVLDYDFIPWQIVDLNVQRKEISGVEYDFTSTDNSVDKQYIIQPFEKIKIKQDGSNKYMISFWRKSETDTSVQNANAAFDNVLPNEVKITENNKPILGGEHQALGDLLNNDEFVPWLMVQWEYETSSNSPINLRFNNAVVGDSPFINTEAGLEYKSLSTFADSIMLRPGESGYIDVVAPNHIQVGRTIFYNIPLMRALATNISDNKPKFMLTLLNDKSNDHMSLESNSYALVFMSASTPQTSNSDIVYVTCYVAPMISSNQTIPPSVSNAVVLSELAFNFDVGNIINMRKYEDEETGEYKESMNNLLIEKLSVITPENKLSKSASTCIGFAESAHQLRISEPIGEETEGFLTVDMKINLQDLAKINLKNAMFTAHGNIIAYDNDGNSLPITKVFGCSLDRIGTKYVLGLTEAPGKVLTVTQNSGRETALQINPETFEQKAETNDSNE